MSRRSTARVFTPVEYKLIEQITMRNTAYFYDKEIRRIYRTGSTVGLDTVLIKTLVRCGIIIDRTRVHQPIQCVLAPVVLKWIGAKEYGEVTQL